MTTPLVRIVDDDADARSSSSFFLSMMGLEIKEYESAQRFLDEDDMNRPGCIILDVRMPDMTGMELQVKLNQKNCRLPIIFLSGHGELDSHRGYTALDTLQNLFQNLGQKPALQCRSG